MLRHFVTSLTFVCAAGAAQAVDLGDMTPQERADFGAAVREYLMENPQVIMEAVQLLEERQQAAQADEDKQLVAQNSDALFADPGSWVGGNPDGDITLVEFIDYRCGYCRRAHPEVARLLEDDGNIRLIVKEFPILGEQSVTASRFAIATRLAHGDDAYRQVSDALIAFSGDYSPSALTRIATSLGLDAQPIFARMEDEEVTEIIRETRALAQRLKISGTPTFVLEDEMLRGYLPYDQMRALVDEQRG